MNTELEEGRFEKLEKLGEGTQGIVWKARDITNGNIVALKKVRTDFCDEGLPSTAIREIGLLREVRHKNVVDLIEVIHNDSNRLYLVFEQTQWDLRKLLEKKPLDYMVAKNLSFQLLISVAWCHTLRVVHRDIKPQNLLVVEDPNESQTMKLADFGLARTVGIPPKPYTHEVVTLWQRAPEVLLGSDDYCAPIDLWSVGCVIYEMIARRPLFSGDSEVDQLFKIFRQLGTPSEETQTGVEGFPYYSKMFPKWKANEVKTIQSKVAEKMGEVGLDLLNGMMQIEPSKRITARTALNHPWFDDLDKSEFLSELEAINNYSSGYQL